MLFGGAPLGEQHSLAEACRGAEQDELAVRASVQEIDEMRSRNHALTQRWYAQLRIDQERPARGSPKCGLVSYVASHYECDTTSLKCAFSLHLYM
jgi:hypothetical protein